MAVASRQAPQWREDSGGRTVAVASRQDPQWREDSGGRTVAGGAVAGGQWREAQWHNQAVTESRSIPPAWERSRARVVATCELVEDVGDEGADDGDGVGDAAAGAGRVDDECAQGRSVRDADEAS